MTKAGASMDDRDYWERHARRYDTSLRLLLGEPLPRMLELTSEAVRGCERLLEMAAGTGENHYYSVPFQLANERCGRGRAGRPTAPELRPNCRSMAGSRPVTRSIISVWITPGQTAFTRIRRGGPRVGQGCDIFTPAAEVGENGWVVHRRRPANRR